MIISFLFIIIQVLSLIFILSLFIVHLIMGYSSKIITVFKKREDSLHQHKSVFEKNAEPKVSRDWRKTISIAISLGIFLLLLFSAILVIIVPDEVWTASSEKIEHKIEYNNQNKCTIANITQITDVCNVQCTIISNNPGQIMAEYINHYYAEYQDLCKSWALLISDTRFPNDTLSKNWLPIENVTIPDISQLLIDHCYLINIEAYAFESEIFTYSLKSLDIRGNDKLNEINYGIFHGLNKLQRLSWQSNRILNYVDNEATNPLKNTLQTIELVQTEIINESIIARILGTCQDNNYTDLSLIQLKQTKGLIKLSRKLFNTAAFTTVHIYLDSSDIYELEDMHVFDDFKLTVEKIYLENNMLKTIPNGVFDGFHKIVALYLDNNKFHCDCHLQYLQNLTTSNGTVKVMGIPKCFTPESQSGIPIRNANLYMTECEDIKETPPLYIDCSDKSTTITHQSTGTTSTGNAGTTITENTGTTLTESESTTISIEISTEESTTKYEHLSTLIATCPDAKFSTVFPQKYDTITTPRKTTYYTPPVKTLKLPGFIPGFTITEIDEEPKKDYTKLNVTTGISKGSSYDDAYDIYLFWSFNDNISCLSNAYDSLIINDILRNTLYTFCLLHEAETYPTHCKSIKTNPIFHERTWVTYGSKDIVIGSFTAICIFCIIVSILIVLFIFWKNRKLFKPKVHDTIVIPIPSSTSTDTLSVNSDNPSYVSILPISSISLFVFRFREKLRQRHKERLETQKSNNTTSTEIDNSY